MNWVWDAPYTWLVQVFQTSPSSLDTMVLSLLPFGILVGVICFILLERSALKEVRERGIDFDDFLVTNIFILVGSAIACFLAAGMSVMIVVLLAMIAAFWLIATGVMLLLGGIIGAKYLLFIAAREGWL